MPTFCNCDTCKAVKKRILNTKCPYCGDHHDKRIHCIQEMNRTGDYMLNADETMKNLKKKGYSLVTEKSEYKDKYTYLLHVANKKYTLFQKEDGTFEAHRYGKEWRDLTGDNLVFNLMVELIDAKAKIKECIEAIPNIDCTHEYLIGILKGEK